MAEPLPVFPYHPDPVATGAVARRTVECACCGRARRYVYTGPVYAADDLDRRLCPWCIADGSAARRFDASFFDGTAGERVPHATLLAVARHTPGYSAWQEPLWYFHCGDGAAFLGAVGGRELADRPEALEALRRAVVGEWGWTPAEAEPFLRALDRGGPPTGYLFQCRTCACYLGHADGT